jgi:hypothetical protein
MSDLINAFWILFGMVVGGFLYLLIADYFDDRRR